MIGQQIGFNLSEVFDPQFGQAGSLVGDMYFMITLIVFLSINGHLMLLKAVHESFKSVPLMSLGFDRNLFDTFTQLFTTATTLAMRLAAPMFFTMLVVDLAMGCIGKAMPQFNIMSAGLPDPQPAGHSGADRRTDHFVRRDSIRAPFRSRDGHELFRDETPWLKTTATKPKPQRRAASKRRARTVRFPKVRT